MGNNNHLQSEEPKKPISNGKKTVDIIFSELLKQKIMEEEYLSINIFKTFAFFGIVSAWLFNYISLHDSEHGLYGSASIIIWSYGTTLVSLMAILILKNIFDQNFSMPNMSTNSLSGVLTMILITWLLSINLKHFKKINMNTIPTKYSNYSSWTSLLIIVQSFFVFLTAGNTQDNDMKTFIKKLSSLNYVIILLTFILVLIQQIILDKFSVDVL